MSLIMDSSYSEKQFLDDFKKFYEDDDDHDLTIVFDTFYDEFISVKSSEFLKTVYQFYYNIDDENELEELNEEVLYQTLYNIVETEMVNSYESEAETDSDE